VVPFLELGITEMRAFVLSIVLLVGSPILGQQPKTITNSIGIKLVRIHAGSFTMGSPVDEEGRKDMQESAYAVSISKSYYLGVYEATQGQYETVR
jgi:formylglycine-generating enzyme required for sulfatase activity